MRKLNSCKCVGHRATGLTLIRSMSGEKDECREMGDGGTGRAGDMGAGGLEGVTQGECVPERRRCTVCNEECPGPNSRSCCVRG